MKLLMIYTDRFHYQTAVKVLGEEPDRDEERELQDVLVGLIHVEAADEVSSAGVEKKLVKNLKWGARKNDTQRIVLHSFSHLAETKAGADFTRELLNRSAERLRAAEYPTWQTPFGYFLDLDLQAPGRSTARIFTPF